MRKIVGLMILAAVGLPMEVSGQEISVPCSKAQSDSSPNSNGGQSSQCLPEEVTDQSASSPESKWRSYLTETFANPTILTGGAFRASVRTADPPKGYPIEWRRGPAGFGRNLGDALAESVSLHTVQALTAMIAREDRRYVPSRSHNELARAFHALAFTVIDRSDSGRPMPAWSNLTGAAAGGVVGNAYLPTGFNNLTHAGQRATILWGGIAAGNLFQEFAPQIPKPIRVLFALLAQ